MLREAKEFVSNWSQKERYILFVLFAFLFVYLILRSIYVPLLHDEVATFFYYIQTDVYLPPNAHWDANNHLLNSALGNISYHLFGNSPFSLRLPNVISYIFYFWGIVGIASFLKKSIHRWGLVVAVSTIHYIIEYFGECRGYGLSLGCLLPAIYFTMRALQTNDLKWYFLSGFFLFIGTSANLTLIGPSIIIYGLLLLHSLKLIKTSKKQFLYRIGAFLITGLPFLYLIKFSLDLKEKGALYYGSLEGFYDVTLNTLSEIIIGSNHVIITVLITLIALGCIIFSVFRIVRYKVKFELFNFQHLGSLLLLGSIAIILVLAWVMKVNFPEDRAGMYLIPLFIIAVFYTLDALSIQYKWISGIGLLFLFFPISFIAKFNTTTTSFSIEERVSEDFYHIISKKEFIAGFPVTVGGYTTQELCWYYSNLRNDGVQGRLHRSKDVKLDADYQIVDPKRLPGHPINELYHPVLNDEVSSLILFERNKKLVRIPLQSTQVENQEYYQGEYLDLLKTELTTGDTTLFVGIKGTLHAEKGPFVSWLVASVQDENGNDIAYEYIALDWMRRNWKGEKDNLIQGTLLHNLPKNAKSIGFYLWNQKQEMFSLTDAEVILYGLREE